MVAWLVAIVVAMASSAWGQAGTAGSGEHPLTPCARLEYGNNEAYNYNMTTIDRYLCSLAADQCFACADLAECDLCPLIETCDPVCVAIGEACAETADCCEGACVDGICTVDGGGCCIETGLLAGRSRLWCDVTDPRYGAIPSDGLDDTAAFQKAFNDCVGDPILSTEDCGATNPAAFNRSGIVYAPQGTYDICNPAEALTFSTGTLFSDGASLWGDGPQATVLRCLTQLGDCTTSANTDQNGRSCQSALFVTSDPCYLPIDNSSQETIAPVTLKGFSLIGPGYRQNGGTKGVRLANTDGIIVVQGTNFGGTVEHVEVSGFDTAVVTTPHGRVANAGFWANYDHLALSEVHGSVENVVFGAAGRANIVVDPVAGLNGAVLASLSTENVTPFLLYQPTYNLAATNVGSPMLTAVTIDHWQVRGLWVGNAAFYAETIAKTGNNNTGCTANNNPYDCCTGANAGTCEQRAGTLRDVAMTLELDVDANGSAAAVAPNFIPWFRRDALMVVGGFSGRNRLDVRTLASDLIPITPKMVSPVQWWVRNATALSGTRLYATDETTVGVVMTDGTNLARVQACDNLETCATVITATTTSTSTSTTTLPPAGEACNAPTVIAAGGGTASGDLSANADDHYAGAVALSATTTLGTDTAGGDRVYSWTPSTTGLATIDTCTAAFFGLDLSVRTAPCYTTASVTPDGLQRVEGQTVARCNPRVVGGATTGGATACSTPGVGRCRLRFSVTAAQTYYILVDHDAAFAGGAYTLTVTPP